MSWGGTDPEVRRLAQERRDACVNQAINSGLKAGAQALVLSGGCFFLLQRYSDTFHKKFPVSTKAAFVVIPAFFLFTMESHLALERCARANAPVYKNAN